MKLNNDELIEQIKDCKCPANELHRKYSSYGTCVHPLTASERLQGRLDVLEEWVKQPWEENYDILEEEIKKIKAVLDG